MRIAIIETGAPPDALGERQGYPAMFERLLAPAAPNLTFFTVAVHRGEAPPALASFDGMLVTGSAAGVYDGHSWIAPTEELVRRAASAGKPQVGVCFGHQLMAQAFGGRVERSANGWGVGVHDYRVTGSADWMRPAAGRLACAASHQDQVIAPPPGAVTLAASDFCAHAAFAFAQGPAISFQMHPDFDHDYAQRLLRLRADRMPAAVSQAALSTFGRRTDRGLIARWIANFYAGA